MSLKAESSRGSDTSNPPMASKSFSPMPGAEGICIRTANCAHGSGDGGRGSHLLGACLPLLTRRCPLDLLHLGLLCLHLLVEHLLLLRCQVLKLLWCKLWNASWNLLRVHSHRTSSLAGAWRSLLVPVGIGRLETHC